jgi:hypothetical protein
VSYPWAANTTPISLHYKSKFSTKSSARKKLKYFKNEKPPKKGGYGFRHFTDFLIIFPIGKLMDYSYWLFKQ